MIKLKKLLLCLNILFSIVTGIKAQQLVGQVCNKVTKKPIPYASITNSKKSVVVMADSTGVFLIEDISKYDSLKITSMGYQSISIIPPTDSIKSIYLEELNSLLKEVVIVKNKPQKLRMGALQRSANGEFGEGNDPNYEVALMIPNPMGIEGGIQTVSFYFAKGSTNNIPFRIHIYTNHNGTPGEEITSGKIIMRSYRKNTWNNFDMSKYHIKMPENGCFASMEWLDLTEHKGNMPKRKRSRESIIQKIGMTTEFSECMNFIRTNSGQWYSGESVFTLKRGIVLPLVTIYNPMIRLEAIF